MLCTQHVLEPEPARALWVMPGVPDQREFEPFFAANISLHDLAVMNANGDADSTLGATGVLLAPAFDRFHDFQDTHSHVCGISRARQGRAQKMPSTRPPDICRPIPD